MYYLNILYCNVLSEDSCPASDKAQVSQKPADIAEYPSEYLCSMSYRLSCLGYSRVLNPVSYSKEEEYSEAYTPSTRLSWVLQIASLGYK